MAVKYFATALEVCCAAHAGTAVVQQTPAEATGGFGAGPSQQIGNVNIGPLFAPSFEEDRLLGDWGGVRSYLVARASISWPTT